MPEMSRLVSKGEAMQREYKCNKHWRQAVIGVGLLWIWMLVGWSAAQAKSAAEPHRTLPTQAELTDLPPDGGEHYNRLVFEQSPYLLQHATNPIDWYPWGEAAFDKAKREDKPIFLSIGYSTCHWCHVMERESFADAEVAQLMSKYFVAVKVDREERPDIDHVYMQVCQRTSRSCGWPLNVIMTPDRKPFFVSTYIPKLERFGRPGMMELLPQVDQVWRERKEDVHNLANRVVAALQVNPQADTASHNLDKGTLELAYEQLSMLYDAEHGGMGKAPKFPKPLMLSYLLRYWKRTGDPNALEMVEHTLQAIRRGGIYDHVGFGFHRYATDNFWLLPHFEKMLYNQALLLMVYTEAYQSTGKSFYAETAREIATYVLRDMTGPEGGFYSAEDADSEGEEGIFYLWTTAEVEKVLGAKEAKLFKDVYHLMPDGNFQDGKTQNQNIPHLTSGWSDIAERLKLSEEALRQRLERSRERLFAVRKQRIHPFKDDKVLTDWNGLMIAAFAKAGQGLDEPAYVEAAKKAADFLLRALRDDDGRLVKRYRQGRAGLTAHINDYAYVIWGLLDLYEATFEVPYLQTAADLQHTMLTHFWDEQQGGFFYTANDSEKLLTRRKDAIDMALPSGNSVAALNLLRLERMTANTAFADKAAALLRAFAGEVSQYPSSYSLMMSATDFALGPSFEVVISGGPGSPDTVAMLSALWQRFLPHKVVGFRPGDVPEPPIAAVAPFTQTQKPLRGKATAYVCQNYICNKPTTDPQAMLTALGVSVKSGAKAQTKKP